jgi:hypothetical protein
MFKSKSDNTETVLFILPCLEEMRDSRSDEKLLGDAKRALGIIFVFSSLLVLFALYLAIFELYVGACLHLILPTLLFRALWHFRAIFTDIEIVPFKEEQSHKVSEKLGE